MVLRKKVQKLRLVAVSLLHSVQHTPNDAVPLAQVEQAGAVPGPELLSLRPVESTAKSSRLPRPFLDNPSEAAWRPC